MADSSDVRALLEDLGVCEGGHNAPAAVKTY